MTEDNDELRLPDGVVERVARHRAKLLRAIKREMLSGEPSPSAAFEHALVISVWAIFREGEQYKGQRDTPPVPKQPERNRPTVRRRGRSVPPKNG